VIALSAFIVVAQHASLFDHIREVIFEQVLCGRNRLWNMPNHYFDKCVGSDDYPATNEGCGLHLGENTNTRPVLSITPPHLSRLLAPNARHQARPKAVENENSREIEAKIKRGLSPFFLGREILRLMLRIKQRRTDGQVKEFDAIAATADLLCPNSTKATLTSAAVDSFVADIAAFRDFFPEYRHLPVVGILATLAVEKSVLNFAEKMGFLVLAVGDEIMEVKNRPGFEPKRW
jgi:hypothetical protein